MAESLFKIFVISLKRYALSISIVYDDVKINHKARVMVSEKNSDELFQNFIWHTKGADFSAASQDPNDIVPVTGQQVKQDKEQGILILISVGFGTLNNLWYRFFSYSTPPYSTFPGFHQ